MNKKIAWGLLGVAALATAGITLPDYGGGTRLGFLGDFGLTFGNTGTEFGYLDGGGQIAVAPDSSYAIVRDGPGVETRGYEFWIEREGAVDSMVVSAFDTLDIQLLPGEGLTLWGQDGGWPLRSGKLMLEVAPEGGSIECRVLQRSMSYFPAYVLMSQRSSESGGYAGWDFLNHDETSVIALPSGETFTFVMRAVDPRYDHLLRGASPPIRVRTFEWTPPEPEMSLRAWFVNSWTMRFAIEDSLGSETSSIDGATVEATDIYLTHDDEDVSPGSISDLTWGWYFYFGMTETPGTWRMEIPAGAVADTNGTTNAAPLTYEWSVSP